MKAFPIFIENSPILKILTADGASQERTSFDDTQLHVLRKNKRRYLTESRNSREEWEYQC